MTSIKRALQAAAGNAGESLYVEDVFSTYLYTGNGSTQTITNGIDLAGEGGLVWIKSRNNATSHRLCDTERGATKLLSSNETSGETAVADTLTAFNSDGFTLGADAGNWGINLNSTYSQTSWTFRKAPKFFDVVTYTGNSEVAQYVNHNLGVAPAVIILKSLDSAGQWYVWHKDLTSTSYSLRLNATAAESVDTNYEIGLNASDTQIYIDTGSDINFGTGQYVAYLFASDAGGFGDDGSESIIKCGSYTGTGVNPNDIDVGFEPQWLLIKDASGVSNWGLVDNMRGVNADGLYERLKADSSASESTSNGIAFNSKGFSLRTTGTYNGSGNTIIYIAIRRPMKTPESGTEVYNADLQGNTSPTPPTFYSGFPVDAMIYSDRDGVNVGETYSRLTGDSKKLLTHSTAAEALGGGSNYSFDRMDGSGTNTSLDTTRLMWMFKRATGFFDVVAYTGTGSAHAEDHNLGVAPEMMIVRSRSSTGNWGVYHASITNAAHRWIKLNDSAGLQTEATPSIWNDTAPTASVFSVCASTASDASVVNSNGVTYIAYLFATLAGVSKVGSYTGTGSTPINVDCGFSSGARFVMIKRADGTGGWYVHDTTRGIVAGNDPMLRLDSTAAEVTSNDYIDPYPSGFTVSNTFTGYNASGSTYIFLAIA